MIEINECKKVVVKSAVRFILNSGDSGQLDFDKLLDVLYVGDMTDYETRSLIDIPDILIIIDEMISDGELELPNDDPEFILKTLFRKSRFRGVWIRKLDGESTYINVQNYYRTEMGIDRLMEMDDMLKNFNPMVTYENVQNISRDGMKEILYPLLVRLIKKENISGEQFRELVMDDCYTYYSVNTLKSDGLCRYLRDVCKYILDFGDNDCYMSVLMKEIDRMFDKCKSGISRKTAVQRLIRYEGEDDVEKMYKCIERYNDDVEEVGFFKGFRRYYNGIMAEELLE